MKNEIILFGLGPAGLFLARQLHKCNYSVIGIGRYDDIGLYSNCVCGYIAESNADVLRIVHEIVDSRKKKLRGYICSDRFITLFLNECPEIFQIIDFAEPCSEILEIINNKKRMIKFCSKFKISIPVEYDKCIFDKPENSEMFPLAFKLREKKLCDNNTIGKMRIVNNYKEMMQLKSDIMHAKIDFDELIIQSYILGKNDCQFSLGGYFYKGEPLAEVVVNQVKQAPQGVSALVYECLDRVLYNRIRDNVLLISRSFFYSGFLEIEFKYYKDKDELYLLDINPRPWGWVSLLGVKYPDLFTLFSVETTKKRLTPLQLPVFWKSPLRIILAKRNTNNVSLINPDAYSNKYCAYDIFDRSDMRPMFAIPKISILKIIKNIKKNKAQIKSNV